MILSTKNDQLYDSKNFDRYKNVYAIMVDRRRIDKIETYNFEIIYTRNDQEMWLFVPMPRNAYKIIYGHFYNQENYFLYKDVIEKRLIQYKVNKCRVDNLYVNKFNKIIYNSSYKCIHEQAQVLTTDLCNKNNNNRLSLITYTEETIDFPDTLGIQQKYNNEILNLWQQQQH